MMSDLNNGISRRSVLKGAAVGGIGLAAGGSLLAGCGKKQVTGDVRFTIRGASHEVVWGSSDRVREKARVLTAALRAAGSDTSQIIDVTTPDSLVIRSKG